MKKICYCFIANLFMLALGFGISLADTWTTKAPMPTARMALTSSTVDDKIYAIGGTDLTPGLGNVDINEVYDPITDTWATKSPMNTARQWLGSEVINGKIYAIGGMGDNYILLNTVEEYDPITDTWDIKAPMPTARVNPTCNVVNGKIYTIGGRKSDWPYGPRIESSENEVYDPNTNTWETRSPMPTARQGATSNVVNNRIYVMGGFSANASEGLLNTVEEYNPATDTWSTKSPMPIKAYDSAKWSAEINGKIYVFYAFSTHIYDPVTNTWTTADTMPIARGALTCSTVNESVYIIGGVTITENHNYSLSGLNEKFSLNNTPIANAGTDQLVHIGNIVTLDASNSSDPDQNYPLTFSWSFVSRPVGSSAELSEVSTINPVFTADMPGDYVVQLIVTDSLGLASTADQVMISTNNTTPIADAGQDQSITQIGQTVQVNGNQSYDGDGDTMTYSWTIIEKPAGSNAALSDASTMNPQFIADVHGDYLIGLVVSDPWSSSTQDTVTISFENVVPVAISGQNQSVLQGETVHLDGSGSNDANLDLLAYQWSLISAPDESQAQISEPTSMQTNFIADLPGTYLVSLIVNDGFADSLPNNITIVAISYETAVTESLQNALATVNSFNSNVFKSKNMAKPLTNKINAVLAKINDGQLEEALDQLQNDILSKTDGCASSGTPDNNDWIKDCNSQNEIYPIIMQAIQLLSQMI